MAGPNRISEAIIWDEDTEPLVKIYDAKEVGYIKMPVRIGLEHHNYGHKYRLLGYTNNENVISQVPMNTFTGEPYQYAVFARQD